MESTRKEDLEKWYRCYGDDPDYWAMPDMHVADCYKRLTISKYEKIVGPLDEEDVQKLEWELEEDIPAVVLDKTAKQLAIFMAKRVYKNRVSINARQEVLLKEQVALLREAKDSEYAEFLRVEKHASKLLDRRFTAEQVAHFKKVAYQKFEELTR